MDRIRTILLGLLSLVLVCCTDKGAVPVSCPEFTSVSISELRYSSVKLKAEFSQTSVVSAGFMLASTSQNEPLDVAAEVDGCTITSSITDLEPLTEYSVIAYITNSVGNVLESEPYSFKTRKKPDPSDIVYIEDPVLKKWLVSIYDINADDEISHLEAGNIDVIEMNTDNVYSLVGVESFPNLYHLTVVGSFSWESFETEGKLEIVDLSQNTRLNEINLTANRLKTLILPEENYIDRLETGINDLDSIDLSCLKNATLVSLSHSRYEELDFSGLGSLDELHVDSNPLKSLVLDNNKLKSLVCNDTEITSLDLRKCPLIEAVDCSDCPNLKTVYLTTKQTPGVIRHDPGVEIIITDE